MSYDLEMLREFSGEIGLSSRLRDNMSLEVVLGDGAILCFQNAEREEDCLIGFLDTPWHFHGDLTFADRLGHFIELDQLSFLNGLRAGEIVVCEQTKEGEVVDRWLVHSRYNDEFQHLAPNESLCFRRACFSGEAS